MTLGDTLLLIISFMLGYVGTYAVKAHAERLNLVDKPNHRSSHVKSTPSGGGIGIVLGGTAAGIWLTLFQSSDPLLWTTVICLSLAIAILGLVDDARHVPARIRFSIQLVLAATMVLSLGELPGVSLPFGFMVSGWVLTLLVLLAVVWWINLFNFMDGIDGIAGSQAVFMLVAATGLSLIGQIGTEIQALHWWMLCIAMATFGFLLLNWPPAKIFMGDVGSTYLGFMIAALALLSIKTDYMNYQAWLILAATFVTDATVTLLTRLFHGETIYEAHRSHTYQRLARRWGKHGPATLLFLGINLFWLLPLAWGSIAAPLWSWEFVVIAYAPLVIAAVALGAGQRE